MIKKSTVIKIGIVFTITLFAFIWGIGYLKNKKLFSGDKIFYAVYERVDGLSNASPVLVNGYEVGKIQQIYFAEDKSGKLIVEIYIGDKYPILKNSVAQITSLDLMGTKGIEIQLDHTSTEYYEHGDTLLAKVEEGLSAQILPIKNKAEQLISTIDSVLCVLQTIFNTDTQNNLIQSFASVKTTLVNLQNTTFQLNNLIASEKDRIDKIFANVESISLNLSNNNAKLNNILTNFSSISDSLAKADVANTINSANKALADLNKTIDKINNGNGTLAQLVNNDTLYTNIESATRNLNKLIIDINENPKRYLHFSVIYLGRTTKN